MFAPVRICEVLNEEGVDYVVVGGFAAVVHGSPLPTKDLDVVPSRHVANLDRLGRALRRMNARIRTEGDLDLTFAPSGNLGGFEEWSAHSTPVEIAMSVSVRLASLDDIIESKRAANRPKDLMALPYLESLRDEINRG